MRNGSAGCVCPEICPQFVDPVCGSDGVTYDNTCELQKASCEQEKHIKVMMNGSCGEMEYYVSYSFLFLHI